MTLFILRDVSIIVLAIESIVIGIVLAILLLELRELSRLLREEVKPMLDSTQETMTTVNNTSKFVSKRVSAPIVAVSSFAAGARQTVISLRKGVFKPASGSKSGNPLPPSPPPASPNTEVKNA